MTELERIIEYRSGQKPPTLGWLYVLDADDKSLACLLQVMTIIASRTGLEWPSTEEWRRLLPTWFLNSKVFKEYSIDEVRKAMDTTPVEEWSTLPWDFGSWLDAIKHRGWKWWSMQLNEKSLRIWLSLDSWPASLEAFEQIAKASGIGIISDGRFPP